MNLLTPCEPAMPGAKAEMRPEEAQALDILLHVIKPELIIEVGTLLGGSACIFARHCPVVTFDPSPQVVPGTFDNRPIVQVRGSAPHDLPLLDDFVKDVRRWVFFHDSVHTKDFLLSELEWAFSRGAIAALWHDVALADMLDAIPVLNEQGHSAMRIMDFGLERSSWGMSCPEIWQGIGLCWNGKR